MKRNRIALLAASTVLAVLLTTTDFIKIDASSFPRRMFARFTPEMRATMAARLRHAAQVSWSKVRRFGEFARDAASHTKKEFFFHTPHLTAEILDKSVREAMEDATPCTNPEILNLVESIAHDMGITEVPPVLFTKNLNIYGAIAHILPTNNLVLLLNIQSINYDYSLLVSIIAHELGHCLQFRKSPDSYHPPLDRFLSSEIFLSNLKKLETGADANAAGYQDCQDCLRHIQDTIAKPEGSFWSRKGYFSQLDYQPYLERAVKYDWRCPAHMAMHADPFWSIFEPKFPMEAFLPVMDHRSPYAAIPKSFADISLFDVEDVIKESKPLFPELEQAATAKR